MRSFLGINTRGKLVFFFLYFIPAAALLIMRLNGDIPIPKEEFLLFNVPSCIERLINPSENERWEIKWGNEVIMVIPRLGKNGE